LSFLYALLLNAVQSRSVAAWALLWAVTGEQGLPGGMFFGLWCLYVACHVAAWLATKAHLPGLLGK